MAKKSKEKQGPSFDFGEPPESVKKAIDLLKARWDPSIPEADNSVQWLSDALFKEKFRRLLVIADHYGVKVTSQFGGLELAMKLAEGFVANFDPQSTLTGRGRPRSATDDNHLDLAIEVRTLEDKGHSTSNACAILSGRDSLNGGDNPWKGKGQGAIQAAFNRFNEAWNQERAAIDAALEQMRVDEANRPPSLLDLGKALAPNATENGDEYS